MKTILLTLYHLWLFSRSLVRHQQTGFTVKEHLFFYLDNTGNLKTSSSKRGTNSSLNGTLLGPFFLIWGLKIPPLMPKVQIHLDKEL